MNLSEMLSTVETAAGDPRQGLTQDLFLFISRMTPLVNVDLLVQDDGGRTLLTWRDDEFFGAGWHVPGGIIRFKESAADRIRTCAREELGAEVAADPAPLLMTEGISEQKSRGHHIALLFRCRLLGPPDPARRATGRPASGQWRWHDGCPTGLIDAQRPYGRFF